MQKFHLDSVVTYSLDPEDSDLLTVTSSLLPQLEGEKVSYSCQFGLWSGGQITLSVSGSHQIPSQ